MKRFLLSLTTVWLFLNGTGCEKLGLDRQVKSELRRDKKLVSLGYKCTSRYVIENRYYQAKSGMESNFFDWIGSDNFEDVLKVFAFAFDQDAYDRIFALERLKIELGEDKHYFINPIGLDSIRSIHDVEIGEEQAISDPVAKKSALDAKIRKDYFDKYKRRLERLFKQIKDNASPIFFVRWTGNDRQLTAEQIQAFQALVNRISPNNKHYLIDVGLVDPSFNVQKLESNCRYKFFNLGAAPNVKEAPTNDWCEDHRDWDAVFRWIEALDLSKDASEHNRCSAL